MFKKQLCSYFLLFTVTAVIITASLITTGCKPDEPQPPGDDEDTTITSQFAWDTVNRTTRWRAGSPIIWKPTDSMSIVFEEARNESKPILCYVSRYDKDLTATIEEGLFTADTWGETISERFVAWEVDWWQDPELAQNILSGLPTPALVVLIPSPDSDSNDFRRADFWAGTELLSFPLHEEILPLGNPDAHAAIAGYASAQWDNFDEVEFISFETDPLEFSAERIEYLHQRLDRGLGLMPEEALLLAYDELATGNEIEGLDGRIAFWKAYIEELPVETTWLPDDVFGTDSGWGVDLVRNMYVAACAVATDSTWPVETGKLFSGLDGFIRLQSDNRGGGFPPYTDVRGTFNSGLDYMNDEERIIDQPTLRFGEAQPGPRNVVWVNARLISWWLRLIKWNPDLASHALPGSESVEDFLQDDVSAFIQALENEAGSADEMKLVDQVYMLELYNEVYQLTSDAAYLEKAGEIAANFPNDEDLEWDDPVMSPFYADLALGLHYYGWLADSEDAREVARALTGLAAGYATGGSVHFEEMDLVRLAFACEIVNTKCIHGLIIAGEEPGSGRDLLIAGLRGWDPRKVVQLMDPERDAELIEATGYPTQPDATAYICLDINCYMPQKEPDEVAELMQFAIEDLILENAEKE